jgi:hypothetical protein
MVAMLVVPMLGWAGPTQARETRLAAFALNCFVPTTHGLHTRAVLVGKIRFTNRTVRFVATCFDGPSTSPFPDAYVGDGRVQSVDMSVVAYLDNGNQERVAQNHCQAQGRNGFLTFRCTASEDQGGEVNILVSIAPLHLQVPPDGATP